MRKLCIFQTLRSQKKLPCCPQAVPWERPPSHPVLLSPTDRKIHPFDFVFIWQAQWTFSHIQHLHISHPTHNTFSHSLYNYCVISLSICSQMGIYKHRDCILDKAIFNRRKRDNDKERIVSNLGVGKGNSLAELTSAMSRKYRTTTTTKIQQFQVMLFHTLTCMSSVIDWIPCSPLPPSSPPHPQIRKLKP